MEIKSTDEVRDQDIRKLRPLAESLGATRQLLVSQDRTARLLYGVECLVRALFS